MSKDINVVALVKGEERYIFLFNDNQKSQTLRTLGRYASNSELSFSWHDAAVLSQKVRSAVRGEKSGTESTGSIGSKQIFGTRNGISEDLFSNDDLV